jgi:hypothetical protein
MAVSQPTPPSARPLGVNKAVAAGLAGAAVTILAWGLSLAQIMPPPEVLTAVQTLLTAAIVYLTPHSW